MRGQWRRPRGRHLDAGVFEVQHAEALAHGVAGLHVHSPAGCVGPDLAQAKQAQHGEERRLGGPVYNGRMRSGPCACPQCPASECAVYCILETHAAKQGTEKHGQYSQSC